MGKPPLYFDVQGEAFPSSLPPSLQQSGGQVLRSYHLDHFLRKAGPRFFRMVGSKLVLWGTTPWPEGLSTLVWARVVVHGSRLCAGRCGEPPPGPKGCPHLCGQGWLSMPGGSAASAPQGPHFLAEKVSWVILRFWKFGVLGS
jgi:hypothetical protein